MTEQIMTDRERTALQLSRAREALEKVWPMIEEEDFMTETTESKYTPGPWYATEHPDEESYWVSQQPDGGTFWIAEVMDGLCVGETEANAHLIAAAPDLMEVCSALLETAPNCGCGLNSCSVCASDSLYGRARAAIAKATGEKP